LATVKLVEEELFQRRKVNYAAILEDVQVTLDSITDSCHARMRVVLAYRAVRDRTATVSISIYMVMPEPVTNLLHSLGHLLWGKVIR